MYYIIVVVSSFEPIITITTTKYHAPETCHFTCRLIILSSSIKQTEQQVL